MEKFPGIFTESRDGADTGDPVALPEGEVAQLPRRTAVRTGLKKCVERRRMLQAGEKVIPRQRITAAGNHAGTLLFRELVGKIDSGTFIAAAFYAGSINILAVDFQIVRRGERDLRNDFHFLVEPVAFSGGDGHDKVKVSVGKGCAPSATRNRHHWSY